MSDIPRGLCLSFQTQFSIERKVRKRKSLYSSCNSFDFSNALKTSHAHVEWKMKHKISFYYSLPYLTSLAPPSSVFLAQLIKVAYLCVLSTILYYTLLVFAFSAAPPCMYSICVCCVNCMLYDECWCFCNLVHIDAFLAHIHTLTHDSRQTNIKTQRHCFIVANLQFNEKKSFHFVLGWSEEKRGEGRKGDKRVPRELVSVSCELTESTVSFRFASFCSAEFPYFFLTHKIYFSPSLTPKASYLKKKYTSYTFVRLRAALKSQMQWTKT